MLNRTKQRIITFCFLSCVSLSSFAGFPPMQDQIPLGMNFPGFDKLSAEDQKKFELEMEQMAKQFEEFDKMISALPPEEREEFFRQMEEAAKIVEQMTEEERMQLIEEAQKLAPELFGNTPIDTKPQPENLKPSTIEQESIIKRQDLSKEETAALATLEQTIKLINSFIVNVHSSPEIIGLIDRWGKNNKITNWPANVSSSKFIEELELLVQKMISLKAEDTKTKNYFHITSLAKKTKLVDLLNNLNKELSEYENSVNIQAFGVGVISKETKVALQQYLKALCTDMYAEKVATLIDEVLKEFDKTATDLKKQVKQQEDRARISKQPLRPGSIIGAGSASDERNYATENYGAYDGSYNRGYQQYKPSYDYPSSSGMSANSQPNSSTGTGAMAPSSTPSSSANSKSTEPTDTKRARVKTNPALDKLMGEIEKQFETVATMIQEDSNLSAIKSHLLDSSDANPITAYTIGTVDKRTQDLIASIKELDRKTKSNAKTRADYQEQMDELMTKHSGTIRTLSTTLSDLKKDWENTKKTVSDTKQYAYMKGAAPAQKAPVDPAVPQVPVQLPTQSTRTLFELQDTLEQLAKAIEALGKKAK